MLLFLLSFTDRLVLNRDGLHLKLLISKFDFDNSFSFVRLELVVFSSVFECEALENIGDFRLENIDDLPDFGWNSDSFDECIELLESVVLAGLQLFALDGFSTFCGLLFSSISGVFFLSYRADVLNRLHFSSLLIFLIFPNRFSNRLVMVPSLAGGFGTTSNFVGRAFAFSLEFVDDFSVHADGARIGLVNVLLSLSLGEPVLDCGYRSQMRFGYFVSLMHLVLLFSLVLVVDVTGPSGLHTTSELAFTLSLYNSKSFSKL